MKGMTRFITGSPYAVWLWHPSYTTGPIFFDNLFVFKNVMLKKSRRWAFYALLYNACLNSWCMAIVKIKGHEMQSIHIKDSCDRRALQISNNIYKLLSTIGVIKDDVDIAMERVAMKKAPASVSWYFDGHHLFYSYSAAGKFVENLAVVYKILEIEINALIEERITLEEFMSEFREDHDVLDQRKRARALLGVDHDVIDVDVIDRKYKDLAKEHHPDKDTGDATKFKEINHAHKILKRELR